MIFLMKRHPSALACCGIETDEVEVEAVRLGKVEGFLALEDVHSQKVTRREENCLELKTTDDSPFCRPSEEKEEDEEEDAMGSEEEVDLETKFNRLK
jgi:hypothetical protein